MGTTTNNGWPTPVATDLVKDGWEAIKDLGDAIDTTLGVYSPATPMGVHLSTVTFSGVTSQSINDVFSATYKNYMIVISNLTCATDVNDLRLRLRVSGADNSSNNYERGRYYVGAFATTGAGNDNSTLTNAFQLLQMNNTIQQGVTTWISNPFLTANTVQYSIGAGLLFDLNGGVTTVTTSYTGFTLVTVAGGNIAGTISTYGLAE